MTRRLGTKKKRLTTLQRGTYMKYNRGTTRQPASLSLDFAVLA